VELDTGSRTFFKKSENILLGHRMRSNEMFGGGPLRMLKLKMFGGPVLSENITSIEFLSMLMLTVQAANAIYFEEECFDL
jgi:hypothetical protein